MPDRVWRGGDGDYRLGRLIALAATSAAAPMTAADRGARVTGRGLVFALGAAAWAASVF